MANAASWKLYYLFIKEKNFWASRRLSTIKPHTFLSTMRNRAWCGEWGADSFIFVFCFNFRWFSVRYVQSKSTRRSTRYDYRNTKYWDLYLLLVCKDRITRSNGVKWAWTTEVLCSISTCPELSQFLFSRNADIRSTKGSQIERRSSNFTLRIWDLQTFWLTVGLRLFISIDYTVFKV